MHGPLGHQVWGCSTVPGAGLVVRWALPTPPAVQQIEAKLSPTSALNRITCPPCAAPRCYEVRCRGIQAVSAEGSVRLDRMDACYPGGKPIVIKIVDTCPCNGNEKVCTPGVGPGPGLCCAASMVCCAVLCVLC